MLIEQPSPPGTRSIGSLRLPRYARFASLDTYGGYPALLHLPPEHLSLER